MFLATATLLVGYIAPATAFLEEPFDPTAPLSHEAPPPPRQYLRFIAEPDPDGIQTILGDPRFESVHVNRAITVALRAKDGPIAYLRPAMHRLTDGNPGIARSSLKIVEAVGTNRDCPPLVALMDEDEDVALRYTASRVLAKLGDHRGLNALDVWLAGISWEAFPRDYRKHVVEQRDRLATRLVRERVERVASPADEHIRRMTDPVANVRLAAVRQVAAVGTRADLPPVVALLSDEDATVRKAAADTIASLGGVPALIALDCWLRGPGWGWILEDVRPHVRAARNRLADRLRHEAEIIPIAPPPRAVAP